MKALLRNLTLTIGLIGTGAAIAASHNDMHGMPQHGDIQVQHAYVRAVPPGQPNSAAFMTLRNKSDKANAVVAASSPAASAVELHTHTMDDGMMKMRQIAKIDIPANGEAVLKPGGMHIMLIGLKEQLKPGMKVSLSLKFANGKESTIEAPVQQITQMMNHNMGAPKMSH